MTTPLAIPSIESVASADRVEVRSGVSWSDFEALLTQKGEAPVPRLAYLEGGLELMSPSLYHERIKSFIGRLVEVYAFANDIELTPYGSWTLKNHLEAAGLEPDECYIVGEEQKEIPDLAIEVVWTSGGIDKLEIYRRLGVPEVWRWQKERLTVYVLQDGRFQESPTSRLFPHLDLVELASYLHSPTLTQAVKAFQRALAR